MLDSRSRLSGSLGFFILALALLAARGYSDPIPYQVQPIAGPGTALESGGFVPTGRPEDEVLSIDGLSDRGQLLFTARGDNGLVVVLYSDAHFTIVSSGPAPDGSWPGLRATDASVNQQGEVAFAAAGGRAGGWLGLYLWDPQTEQSTPLVVPGLRPVATRSLVFGELIAYVGPPLLNNRGDIAFMAPLSDVQGNLVATGLFFRDHQGQVVPVAVPGDTLPGIGTIHYVQASSLNDSGVAAFLASVNNTDWSAFTWANGKITPVALASQTLSGGKAIDLIVGAWVNDVNQNVLLDVLPVGGGLGDDELYLAKDGQLTPLAVPGQAMPGGGTLFVSPYRPLRLGLAISAPNAAGQSVFVAVIKDGDQYTGVAYRVDADGQLVRLFQGGDTAAGGEMIWVTGWLFSLQGPVLNSKGQLALPLAIGTASDYLAGRLPGMISLLTPTGP